MNKIETEIGTFINPVDYPTKPTKPILKKDATSSEIREFADKMEVYETLIKEYEFQKVTYRNAENKMHNDFKSACFKEIGISETHPKADKLWELAWEKGHSSGFDQIWYWVSELSELIN